MNWKDVLETNAWSQGHGVPNPTVPAALKEWAIPINQLTPEGRRLYEQNIPEGKKLLAQACFPHGLKLGVAATLGSSPDYVDHLQVVMRYCFNAATATEIK